MSLTWFTYLLILLTYGPKVEFSQKQMLRQSRSPKDLLGSHPEKGNGKKHDWERDTIKLQGRTGKVSCNTKKKFGPKITIRGIPYWMEMIRLFTTALFNMHREWDLGKKILKQTLTMLLGKDCQLPHSMQMDNKSFLEEESDSYASVSQHK